MAVDQDPRIEPPRVLLFALSRATLREVLYTLLSLGLGSAGIFYVLWRKAIVEKKLKGAETGLASLHETLALARREIERQRVAAVKTEGNYEHEITLYKAQIATLEKQRASAIEALERAGAPGALRGLLRDKLGLPQT